MRPPAILVFLFAATLPAQAPPPAAAPARPGIRFDATTLILPAGKLGLTEVVNAAATFARRNILLDPREVPAETAVELQTQMTLDVKNWEEAVSELLFARGCVLVPRDAGRGLYEVVLLNGPRGREVFSSAPQRTPEEIMARPGLRQPVATLVRLQTVNATIATNMLRPFFAQHGGAAGNGLTLGAAPDGKSLLLTGIQSDVASAIELIRRSDGTPPADPPAANEGELQRKVTELERTVQELQRRVAELEKRLGTGK